jgi:hypothetical protein
MVNLPAPSTKKPVSKLETGFLVLGVLLLVGSGYGCQPTARGETA